MALRDFLLMGPVGLYGGRMQTANLSFGRSLRAWRDQARATWVGFDPTTRTAVQLSLVLGGTLVAYPYSLLTLVQQLDVQSPLAYVGLVPLFALALAAAYVKPKPNEPDIYDRQLDYIVGVPLLAVAAVITILLPHHMSANYWQWRVDLVAVPLWVAGLLAIVFGVRVLWRQRLSVLYLLLALPALYTVVLNSVLLSYTNFTVSALADIVAHVRVATADAPLSNAVFVVTHHGHSFALQVVTACSGVDGLVGFLLIGLLFAAMVAGPVLQRALWLLAGLPLLWAINLGRMLFIFWTGKEWGETVALDVFHPFIGLVTFSAGVAIWALAHRWFGLRIKGLSHRPEPQGGRAAAQPTAYPRALAVPTISGAAILVVIASLVVGLGDNSLRDYNLIENAVGQPKLISFLLAPAHVAGWSSAFDQEFTNGEPEFGPSSLWFRYLYREDDVDAPLRASVPVFADVINAPGLSGFAAFTVQDCYTFHGWDERGTVDENLGGGIVGQALSYDSTEFGDWSLVYWIWPVNGTMGDPSATRYERVVLYLQDGPGASVKDPTTGETTNMAVSLDQRLSINRDFLTSFAREIIKGQKAATSEST
jgi:exosortase/archaeosortase family protein